MKSQVLSALLASVAISQVVAAGSVVTPRPDLVAKVIAGEIAEARVSWWGFEAEDSTSFLQAALSSGAPRIIIDKMESPWVARPLRGASNQTVFFEAGAEVIAKKGEFMGTGDCLLSFLNATNVTLRGSEGSALRMNRWDYHADPYKRGEWRHALCFRSSSDIYLSSLFRHRYGCTPGAWRRSAVAQGAT